MRKPHLRRLGLPAAALLACIGTAAAQTTFATSNDPNATVSVVLDAARHPIVTIERPSRPYPTAAISEASVLRDASAGIAYELRGHTVTLIEGGATERHELRFRALDADAARLDLIDPVRGQQCVYVSQIQVGGE